jgi:hypothetical protein
MGDPEGPGTTGQLRPGHGPEYRPPVEPDHGPYFTGTWLGRALYRCPFCRIAKTDRGEVTGDAAIRTHLIKHHATAHPTPEQRARAAGLVITDR